MQSIPIFLKTWSPTVHLHILVQIVTFLHTISGQNYEPFCDPAILYRPYLKYYDGRVSATRNENAIRVHGPGFYSDFMDEKMQNVYICINGIVWLYFSATEQSASIFESPKLHIFHHHCMLANPRPGPGPHQSFKRLLAILLVGNPRDYRLPAMQLFYAPYYTKGSKEPPYNTSSLFIVGDETECVIQKGHGEDRTHMRLRTTPMKREPELSKFKPNAGTFCKAAYTNFKENLNSWASVGQMAFRSDRMVVTAKNCFVPENYTEKSIALLDAAFQYFKDLDSTSNADKKIADRAAKFKLFSGDVALYFDKPDRIPAAQKEYWPAVCPSANECKQTEIDKAVAKKTEEVKAANPTKSPPEKRELIIAATLKMKLANCMDYAFAIQDVLKTIKADGQEPWTEAKTLMEPATTAFRAAQVIFYEAEAKFKELSLPLTTEIEEFEKAKEAFFKAETEYLEKKDAIALAISVGRVYVEKIEFILGMRATEAYENLVRQYKVGSRGGKTYCPEGLGDEIRFLPTLAVIKRPGAAAAPADPAFGTVPKIPFKLDPVEMTASQVLKIEDAAKDPTKYEDDTEAKKTCGYLPKVEDVCRAAKPNARRSCQILQAMMGSEEAVGVWDTEDEWRQEVLDLIEDIYLVAVRPSIDEDIITGVSHIIKAYFTNTIEGTKLNGKPKKAGSGRRKRQVYNYEDEDEESQPYDVFNFKRDSPTKDDSPDMEQLSFLQSYLGEVNAFDADQKKMKERQAPKDKGKSAGNAASSTEKAPKTSKESEKAPKTSKESEKAPKTSKESEKAPKTSKESEKAPKTSKESEKAPKTSKENEKAPGTDKKNKKAPGTDDDNETLLETEDDSNEGSSNDFRTFDAGTNKQPIELPRRRQFWPQIIAALNECKSKKIKIYLHREHNFTHELYSVYKKKPAREGLGYDLIPITENIEQADDEYAFNWAIDMNWFMFATVMGVCMPAYENKVPLISARFYSLYTEDFLIPLGLEWVNPRDNGAYQLLGGQFYRSLAPKMFMEGSYVLSGDVQYRPPRKLLVNDHSEANFFIRGVLTGSQGRY